MTIPSFENLRLYILKHLANGGTWRKAQLVEPIVAPFNLSAEDIAQEYESGNGAILADRTPWALSYPALSGLLSRPKRGHYASTDLGNTYAHNSEAVTTADITTKQAEP